MFRIIKFIFSKRIFYFIYNVCNLWNHVVSLKYFPKVNGLVFLKIDGHLLIGKNVVISSHRNANVIGGDTRTNILISKDALLTIGNNVGISNTTLFCEKSIIIEDNVLIGGSCKIYDTDFHSVNFNDRMNPFLKRIKDNTVKTAAIVIKNGVWIGGHCIILKGVTIGEKSIIGAGSVVTKNVPAYEIWAGNPANFIRKIEKL